MRRLLILAAIATVTVAASGCRCGGLFRRNCVSYDCCSSCSTCGDDDFVTMHDFENDAAPIWEESIPVPRAR